MKIKIFIYIILIISLASCQDKVSLLSELDTSKDVKFYFLSSEIMGPNIEKVKTEFQKNHQSFYIDDSKAIEILKQNWKFTTTENFDAFSADYYITYTEDNIYRGKISIDLGSQLAVSGYGPTTFDNQNLYEIENYIKPLTTRFFEFSNLKEARVFYKAIKDKQWLLPSPSDDEYYKWLDFEGESIIQVNNKKFARDKDIKKAFKKYMPKRFSDTRFHYNIFRFTPENSTVRICSDKDLSPKFPEDFHVIIPWQKYNSIILPLVDYDENKLQEILFAFNITQYKIIDKIE